MAADVDTMLMDEEIVESTGRVATTGMSFSEGINEFYNQNINPSSLPFPVTPPGSLCSFTDEPVLTTSIDISQPAPSAPPPQVSQPTSRKKEKKNKNSSPGTTKEHEHHHKHKKSSRKREREREREKERERDVPQLLMVMPRQDSSLDEYLSSQPPSKKAKKKKNDEGGHSTPSSTELKINIADKQPILPPTLMLDNSTPNYRYRVAMGRVGGTWYLLSIDHRSILDEIHRLLVLERSDVFASKQMKYHKQRVKSLGVKREVVTKIFLGLYSQVFKSLIPAQQVYIAYKLLESEYIEEKHVGVLALAKVLHCWMLFLTMGKNINFLGTAHIPDLLFLLDTHVHEWSTSDFLANHVISAMISRAGESVLVETVASWAETPNAPEMRLRATCIAFLKLAKLGKRPNLVLKICSECLKYILNLIL